MKPSSYPDGLEAGDNPIGLSQNWHKYGKCPSGTIPISRTQSYGHKKGIPFAPNRTRLNISNELIDPTHEVMLTNKLDHRTKSKNKNLSSQANYQWARSSLLLESTLVLRARWSDSLWPVGVNKMTSRKSVFEPVVF